MGEIENYMKIELPAISENEGLARMLVSAFLLPLNPTVEELADVKTALSEAVTNAVIHGYEGRGGTMELTFERKGRVVLFQVSDYGVGIPDVDKAMEPLFTTKPEMERSGMGFTFMEAFMDEVKVDSVPQKGTVVRMKKKLEECGCEV